jgi:hypothetical protein
MTRARVWIAAALAAAVLGAGPSRAAVDSGIPASPVDAGANAPPDEDRELSDNLELLQELDAARDLDLLLELSKKE